jgi:hypothetical protein
MLGLSACTQMTTASNNAFVGPNDLLLVDLVQDGALVGEGIEGINRFLFITSTNSNELRVLDLKSPTATSVIREPLKAPNPLETLSIPVLERPTSLMLDTRYEGSVRRKGSLLYAMRNGGAELSIVGVEPTELRELRRLPLAAPLTAMANLMDDARTSRIWLATFDGADSAVLELSLPASAPELRAKSTKELVGALATRVKIPGASVSAMVAIPGVVDRTVSGRPFCADPAKACLAIATRPISGAPGKTSLLDPATLETVELAFVGPVRGLTVVDRSVVASDGEAGGACMTNRDCRSTQSCSAGQCKPAPGAILYGTLDEETCGSPRCGGVSAVDTRTGVTGRFEVLVVDGAPSQPLRWSDGLVRGLSVVPDAQLRSITSDGGVATFPLLGTLTMSNGQIVFFDASTLSLIDLNRATSTLSTATYFGSRTTFLEGPAISSSNGASGVLTASILDGALYDQTITITWQGELTPRGGVSLQRQDTSSFAAAGLTARIQPGDTVSFTGTSCPVATVTGVSAARVQFAPTIGCDATAAVVRAGSAAPFVVMGSLDGYLGRASAGGTFSLDRPRFLRIPGTNATTPGLVIPFGRGTDTQPPATDVSWSFEVISNITPHVAVIDPSLFTVTSSCPTQLQLPGALAYEPLRARVFLAYPSANLVAEFDARRASAGGLGPNEGVLCHR